LPAVFAAAAAGLLVEVRLRLASWQQAATSSPTIAGQSIPQRLRGGQLAAKALAQQGQGDIIQPLAAVGAAGNKILACNGIHAPIL
jgi:hypothetical protein